jgi:SAM-dependent methyltransferase
MPPEQADPTIPGDATGDKPDARSAGDHGDATGGDDPGQGSLGAGSGVRAPDHVLRNRAAWDRWAADYVEPGRRSWVAAEPSWGLWGIPESELHLIDGVAGLDAIELGCGTAYVSAWLARLGARPVGIDNSPAQLATAAAFQREFRLDFPLILGNAEQVPFADGSFDFAISEYGAAIWCDPLAWIPEAARLLRPGGRLVFLVDSPLVAICSPAEADAPAQERLIRPYFGIHRFEWPDDESVEFHLPHGEMLALLRRSGFEVEALHELQAPEGATTRYRYVTPDWARRWPSEEVWVARRRS